MGKDLSNAANNIRPLTATASASDCACRGSRRLPRFAAPELRRILRRESGALPHGDGSGERQGIVVDVPRLPQPWLRSLTRSGPQAPGGYCRTMPSRQANPHSHLESRRPGASRFLKKARPDLLPRDDIGRVLLMPSDAVLKLRPLRIRQRCRVRFQALPDRIQQFCLLGWGQAIDLASQIVHTFINLARFLRGGKHLMRTPFRRALHQRRGGSRRRLSGEFAFLFQEYFCLVPPFRACPALRRRTT